MFLLGSDEIVEHTGNLIHENTQKHQHHIDLTVSKVYRFTHSASLDFGGSEYESAETEKVAAVKQSKGDKYGWWILDDAIYKVVFNEHLKNLEDTLVAITPHQHALESGLLANTMLFFVNGERETLSMNFKAPVAGCSIKENARFAALHILAS
jgi:hypothetical protein